MTELEEREHVRRLDLRLDRHDWLHGAPDYLVVTILVDGEEIFARVHGQGYVGWHPAAILDPDVAALLPVQPTRRVGLYGWNSYYGAGEGSDLRRRELDRC